MKLSSRTEYALLAILYLAKKEGGDYVTVSEISQNQAIPRFFLEQILLDLKRNKIVHSTKGKNGGFKLNKPSNEISIAEIIRLIDGPLAPSTSVSTFFYKSTPIEKEKTFISLFKEIRDFISDKLEKTTIKDLL